MQTNRMLQQIFITLLLIFHLASSTQENSTDKNVEEVKDEFNGHFSDPSAKAAMIKHIGDMAFIEVPHKNQSTDKTRARRNAIRNPAALWPNARVPYNISSSFSENERNVILKAMRHWEDKTCLRFFPRTTEPYYIYIISGVGCHSFVGRVHRYYQPQGVSLGPGCVHLSTAVHEIGHAIGFYHEHTRHDRDQYVSVFLNNLRDGIPQHNFAKVITGQTRTFGYGYDYASIMHYSGTAGAKSSRNPIIVAKDEGIVVGGAQELSPLDILKANALYQCGSTRPPISTYPPSTKPLTLPDGVTCGGVIESKSGTFYSPGYPNHILNQTCAWVIQVPEGYRIFLSFPELLRRRSDSGGCSKDYIQIFSGPKDEKWYGTKFCRANTRSTFVVSDNRATVYYHTDSSNTGYRTPPWGLRFDFSAIDIDECSGRSNRCHKCTNLLGSYSCECKNGYYHSPAATTCFDFNECAYENGGCDHTCDNNGGSYICTCDPGYYLQADGLSCRTTPPAPSTVAPSTVAPPTVAPPTCGGALTSAIGTLQTPKWPETYPFNFDCEWTISLPNSNQVVELTFNTVFGIAGKTIENCPNDYLKIYNERGLTHTICDLELPSPIRTTSNNVRLVFHAGSDHAALRKGFRITYRAINRPTVAPPTTPTTVPPPTTITTTMSTTTLPPTANICGPTLFTDVSGSFETPAWPETYPLNFDCEWNIQVPTPGCNVRLIFDDLAFGIAGKTTENCPKDYLKIHDKNGLIRTICDLGRPSLITTTGNTTLYFFAGPYHGPKRTGFRIEYATVCPTTPPGPPTTRPTTVATTTPDPTTRPTTVATTTPDPTTRPTTVATTTPDPTTRPTTVATTIPTLVPTTVEVTTPAPTTLPPTPNCPVLITSPQGSFLSCGGFMRVGERFGPANLPSGPITDTTPCQWIAFGSVQVRFKYFDIPSSEECSSNSVAVYNGYGTGAPLIGKKMCGEKCDEYIVKGTGSILTVVLEVSSPGSFKGFYAQFEERI